MGSTPTLTVAGVRVAAVVVDALVVVVAAELELPHAAAISPKEASVEAMAMRRRLFLNIPIF